MQVTTTIHTVSVKELWSLNTTFNRNILQEFTRAMFVPFSFRVCDVSRACAFCILQYVFVGVHVVIHARLDQFSISQFRVETNLKIIVNCKLMESTFLILQWHELGSGPLPKFDLINIDNHNLWLFLCLRLIIWCLSADISCLFVVVVFLDCFEGWGQIIKLALFH